MILYISVYISVQPTQWKSQAKENKLGNAFPHESAYGVGNFSPFKSTVKPLTVTQNSVKEVKQWGVVKSIRHLICLNEDKLYAELY